MAPTLLRATADLHLRDDGAGRTIYGRLVPFGEEAEVNDGRGPYRELFVAGAFARSLSDRATRIRLFVNHNAMSRLPIGRAVELEERADGLHGAFVVSATRDGDEALTLVKDGVVDAFSIGFKPLRERSVAGVTHRTEAALREVSLVSMPAYPGALVGGIRSIPHVSAEVARRRLELLRKAYQ